MPIVFCRVPCSVPDSGSSIPDGGSRSSTRRASPRRRTWSRHSTEDSCLPGQTLSPYDYDRKNIRNDRWSFGFQPEVLRNLQVEVNYVGQRAPNLIASTSASDAGKVVNAGWNGTGGTFDQRYYGLGTRLNARVANPFLGLIPGPSSLAGATVTVAQLLNPYPEFGNINLNRSPGGKSHYHSLQVSVAAVNKIVGGWQWSAMYIYQTGAAVSLPAALATGVSPKVDGPTITRWFNGASMAVLPAFTARRIPYFWDGLRSPAMNNWDMGFIKNTMVYKERMKLQFR
ncbi:MAG: hypothetical protein EXQ52_11715, partial [Bryobacterales bacterium]|nr:hypothetical protein [Bryobacterales bacterium]